MLSNAGPTVYITSQEKSGVYSVFRIAALLLFAGLFISACSDVYDVSYDYDDQYEITSIETYGWLPLSKKNQNRLDDLTFRRIQGAIETDLGGKGLVTADGNPDMLIEVTYGAKGGSRRTTGNRSRYSYKEGYLHIQFVDPGSNSLIWTGSGKVVLENEGTPEQAQKTIDEIVGKIMAKYPPK